MPHYPAAPLDFSQLSTIPIRDRGGKVRPEHFGTVPPPLPGFLDSLPRLLAADSLRAVVAALQQARAKNKAIIWGLGGHVIKCGLAPTLLHLMRQGYATAFAMNGATSIHDFEIAIAGATSEDVESVLPDGRFERKVPYSAPRELLMDILHYGPDAEIVEPAVLREQMKSMLQLAVSNYEK